MTRIGCLGGHSQPNLLCSRFTLQAEGSVWTPNGQRSLQMARKHRSLRTSRALIWDKPRFSGNVDGLKWPKVA